MARADSAKDDAGDRSDGDIMKIPGAKDSIDEATFEQILEMDDDEDEREFSKSIVYDFFTQAESTFEKMDSNLEKKDEKGEKDITEEEGLKRLETTIKQAKQEFHDVEKVLKKFYNDEA